MLRSVTLGLVLSVLAAACALFEPPVPPGIYPMEAEVRNDSAHPVEFSVVRTVGGVFKEIEGAVQPASIPAGPSTTNVTFYLPTDRQWVIRFPSGVSWARSKARTSTRFFALQCRPIQIYFDADGGWEWPSCTKRS